jgi:hypothetical protein
LPDPKDALILPVRVAADTPQLAFCTSFLQGRITEISVVQKIITRSIAHQFPIEYMLVASS